MNLNRTFLTIGLLGYLLLGAPAHAQIMIMPLGDSITWGYNADTGGIPGGYRGDLYTDLQTGNYISNQFVFVGASTENPTGTVTTPNQDHHNGYNGYTVSDISNSLDGPFTNTSDPLATNGTQYGYYGVDYNNGGYWITGNGTNIPAQKADITLLMVGGNDIALHLASLTQPDDSAQIATFDWSLAQNVITLIQKVQRLELGLGVTDTVLVGGVLPFKDTTITGQDMDDAYVKGFDDDLSTLIASTFGTTGHVDYVDQYDYFMTSATGTLTQNKDLFGSDGIHPNAAGYQLLADNFNTAIDQVIPEPSTYAMLLLGGIGLFFFHRRRLKRA